MSQLSVSRNAKKSQSTRHCSVCHSTDHDRRTCPAPVPQSSSVPPPPHRLPVFSRALFSHASISHSRIPQHQFPTATFHDPIVGPLDFGNSPLTPASSPLALPGHSPTPSPNSPLPAQHPHHFSPPSPAFIAPPSAATPPLSPLLFEAPVEVDAVPPPILPRLRSLSLPGDTLLLDIDFTDLGVLVSVGKPLKFLNSRLLHRVRNVFIQYYSRLVDASDNLLLWKQALLLPTLLCVDTHEKSRIGMLTQRLEFLESNDWSTFTLDSFSGRRRPPLLLQEDVDPLQQRFQRVSQLAKAGEFSRAYRTLVSDAQPSVVNAEVLNKLVDLHPVRSDSTNPLYLDPIPADFRQRFAKFHISPQDARSLVFRAGREIAPGVDAMRYELLRQLIGRHSSPAELRFTELLAFILTAIANADLPSPVSRYLAGPELIALQQGTKIRPIALGIVLRSLASKFILTSLASRQVNHAHLGQLQKGINISNGLEQIVHLVNYGRCHSPTLNFLKTDFKNAFNSIDRLAILKEVKAHFPSAYPLVHAMYASPSNLAVFADESHRGSYVSIPSQTGSQQGDVLGSLTFSLGAHPFFLKLDTLLRDTPDSFVKAYIDDGNFLLSNTQLLAVLRLIIEEGPSVGIFLRRDKTEVLLGNHFSHEEALSLRALLVDPEGEFSLSPEHVLLHPQNNPMGNPSLYGSVVLGSPIGSPEYIASFLEDKLRILSKEAERLCAFPDPQLKFLLLHYCFNNKITYLMRTIPPQFLEVFISDFNNLIKSVLSSLLHHQGPLSSEVIMQASLSLKSGGLGLGISPITSSCAFVASFLSTLSSNMEVFPSIIEDICVPSDNINPFIEAFQAAVRIINYKNYNPVSILKFGGYNPDGRDPEDPFTSDKLQRVFMEYSKQDEEATFKQFIIQSGASPSVLARYVSSCGKEAAAAILAVPKSNELTLTPDEFRLMIRRRLGLPLPQIRHIRCSCKNHPILDQHGIHLVNGCPLGKDRNTTHNMMVQTFASLCRSAGLYTKVEVKDAFRSVAPLNGGRPDIEFHGLLETGVFGDVRISEPCSASLSIAQAIVPGRVAQAADLEKRRIYEALSTQLGFTFYPLIFETYGRWGDSMQTIFSLLVKHASEFKGIPLGVIATYWRRRLAITLQKMIARCILARVGRLNSSPFRDESSWFGLIEEQAYARY